MQDKKNNIFENISDEEYRVARRRIIESILSTDMANHGKHLTQLKAKLESLNIVEGQNLEKIVSDNVNKNYESQQMILNMMVHSADVSNPGKSKNVYVKWVDLIFNEFFNQGDIEKSKGLSVSLLCDRESTNINKSQIGFINFIVKPTFECMINIIPNLSVYMDNIVVNCKYYEDLVKAEEEKKSNSINNFKQ